MYNSARPPATNLGFEGFLFLRNALLIPITVKTTSVRSKINARIAPTMIPVFVCVCVTMCVRTYEGYVSIRVCIYLW